MEGSGSLNLAYYGGASCLQLLSLNGSALGSWPLRTAGEEYRHGEPGEDVLLNIEIWNENLGRCLGSCQGALALLGLRENRGKATPLQNRVMEMKKAVFAVYKQYWRFTKCARRNKGRCCYLRGSAHKLET